MKKLIFTSFVLFSFLSVMGTNWINIHSSEPIPAKVNLISSNIETSVLQFSFDGFFTDEVQTPRGIALNINLENTSPLLIAGAPDLLKLTSSVIIPDLAKMELKVISSSFKDYKNMDIAPSKGNFTRDIDPATVPYVYGKQYEQDRFFPEELAELRDPYIIRDYRGQTIVVYPFQYNPVTKILRVYYDITIEVKKVNNNGINPLIRDRAPEKISTEFKNIYQRQFLNANSSRYTPVDDHGNMLIICYADFMSAIQPFIEWKIQTGMPTEIVDVATIGNSAAIKTYIANYYNNNGLTFVLLVGDGAQVPTSYSNGDSDNDYSYIVGNDHYPDLFVGRFSAENIAQVETQVERTLTYEQDPYRDIDWFTIGTGIASSQGPGDDGEYDYEHIRNINTDLLGFTYTYCNELFDGSQGGNDAPGNPTPALVAQAINDGTTIINYCGHGSTTSWSTSGFSNNDVNNLTNTGMLPFIWSVACVNGNFVGTTCFAEAWLRAEHNGEPSGAVATLMSTINQSWNPPMCGQDEMVDILVESYQNNIKRTFGGISMNGCMQMNDEYGSGGDAMTDTWTCFGDPSLMVRTAVPQDMTVSYYTTVFIGATQLTVNANAEGSVVALTLDGAIISTAFIENGTATLQFDELTAPGTLTITITGFNFLPHIGTIEIVPANCPYIVYESNQVIDTAGNNNNMIDFGESIQLTLAVKNIGGEPGNDVVVDISTNDDYIILNDSTENYGNIASGQTVSVEGGFAFDVSNGIPDQHMIILDITITDSEDSTWYSTCQLIANAPVLSIGNMIIDDETYGNNNGRLDPGETADIKIKNYNLGHCFAENTIATLTTASQYITMHNTTDTLGTLGFFGSVYSIFTVTVDPETPNGVILVEFDYELVSGIYQENETFIRKIGLLFEDFETGNFTKFNWQHDGDLPWFVSNLYPYEGYYSAKSGAIGDNQYSELSLTMETMTADSISFIRKVSSESGDKLKFFINGSLKDEWSGTTQGWVKEIYPVGVGTFTFEWVYEKNAGATAGADCAWLDYIIMPPEMTLTCYAGPDDYVCEGDDFQCMGEATDWVSVEWTTSGIGTFSDPTILQPIYTPSIDDITAGLVILTITATDSDGDVVDDDMDLTFKTEPEAPDMPTGPDYVDLVYTTTSEYTVTQTILATSYDWNIEPVEAGTISGNDLIGTVEWDLTYLGYAYISVKAINECGESEYSDAFEVTVDNTVVINENINDLNIRVYPNPSTGNFTINLNSYKTARLNIKIINPIGSLVYKESNIQVKGSYTNTLDLSNLPVGIYYLIIEGDNINSINKIMIQK